MVCLKIQAIEKYLEIMEKWKQTNSIYYSRLLFKIVEIAKRIQAFDHQSKKKTLSYKKACEKIPEIVNILFICLSKEANQEYHQSLVENLFILSQILNDSDILFEKAIYLFLLNSESIKHQNEGLNILKKLIEQKKILKTIELSEMISEFNKKMIKKKDNYEESLKKLPKEDTFEMFDNEQKYKQSLKALETIKILLNINVNSS